MTFISIGLFSGEPVNDETVSKQIRNGSAGMPSFRNTLTDADIADLVSYLRDKCCYEERNPPLNPWYRGAAQNGTAVQGRNNLKGGARGVVRTAGGELLEGIMVQLIAPTVFAPQYTATRTDCTNFLNCQPHRIRCVSQSLWSSALRAGFSSNRWGHKSIRHCAR